MSDNMKDGETTIARAAAALNEHHYEAVIVGSKAEALAFIKETIPQGASVMNGASRTLEVIGYISYLKEGKHGWKNLHADILAEKDPTRQAAMRKQATISDYYLGSVHALTEEGEMLIASNSGSQLPHLAFTSPNIILVVGSQKIVPTLDAAFRRLREVVIPLEEERMKQVYGFGTTHAKTLILHQENPAMGRSIKVLIVNEALGF